MELTCIVCPNGCQLKVTKVGSQLNVEGARCKRGESFAQTELTRPMRTVTSSVKTTVKGYPVVSVRTDGEIPKDKIFDLMSLLQKITIDKCVPIGTIVVSNVFYSGVNVITTTAMEQHE